jgi:hypothetical protein
MVHRQIWTAGAAILGLVFLVTAPVFALEVVSAKRVEKFTDPSSGSDIMPGDANEVVLIVDLGGISLDAFQAIPREEIAVSAGDRRFEPRLSLSRDWFMVDGDNRPVGGVQEERRLVFVVPRDVLEFSLQFGKLQAVTFKADANITAVLP